MNQRLLPAKRARRGFTLIELLVVIAIIAILAAILFPVFNTIRENARQATCTQNLQDIVRAMKMYHDDWGKYPDVLYGASYAGGPLDLRLGVTKYIDNPEHFTCPNHPPQLKKSQVLSPCIDPRTNAPSVDLLGRPVTVPELDSYTCQRLPNTNPAATRYLNYNLRWGAAGAGGNAVGESPRQLYRRDPPADTVVTWCMYHTNINASGQPGSGTKAIVAFIGGQVKKVDAQKMLWTSTPPPWQVTP